MAKKQRTKLQIILFSIGIVVFLGFIITGTLATETQKKPIITEKKADYNYLYNFYVAKQPNIEGRPYYGEAEAPLTLVLYTDFRSAGAQAFAQNILPPLKQEYLYTGKAKLYIKHHLLLEDLEEQNEQYYLALALECYAAQNTSNYYDFLFNLYNTSLQDVPELAQSLGADRPALMTCIKQQTFKRLQEDISEVEQFGMRGIAPRLYIGIQEQDYIAIDGAPNYERIKRALINYQTRIGD